MQRIQKQKQTPEPADTVGVTRFGCNHTVTAASYKRSWWPVSTVTLDPAFREIMCLPASAILSVAVREQKQNPRLAVCTVGTTSAVFSSAVESPHAVGLRASLSTKGPGREHNSQLASPPLPMALKGWWSVGTIKE